jgi:hypothetical protein
VEYVAIVALIAAVLGGMAVTVVATGVGERLVAAMRHALCVATGGVCGHGPCVVTARRETSSGELDVGFARLGSEETLLREQRADGTVALTLMRHRAGGPQLGIGGDAHVGELAVGAEARLALLARSGSGETYVAAGPRVAAELERRLRLSVLARRPETTIDNPVGGLPDMSRPMQRLPPPATTFHEHGAAITLDLGARVAPVRAALRLGSDDMAGERIDTRTGRRTLYLRRTGELSGSLSVLTVGGVAAGTGRELYAVTVDRDGRPLDLEVLDSIRLGAGAHVPVAARNVVAAAGVPIGRGRLVEVESHLDLRDAESLAAATAFLEALVGSGRTPPAGGAAALDLRRRLDLTGTTHARVYATSESERGIGGHLAGGLRVGGSTGTRVLTSRLVAAVGCAA